MPDNCDLSFFKHLNYLEQVELRGNVLDLTGISQMTWLKDLRISGRNIDVPLLSNLTNLECLHLWESGGEDGIALPLSIATMENYENLQELSLNGYMVESLKGLEAFPNLRLFDCESGLVEDISVLKSLRHMERLDSRLISWRNTLLSLLDLQCYAGGPYVDEWGNYDTDWVSQNLSNEKVGYSDMG